MAIASNAGLLSARVRNKTLRLGMAERYKFIIDFSKYPIGTQVVLQNPIFSSNIDSDTRTHQVMRFDVVRQETDFSASNKVLGASGITKLTGASTKVEIINIKIDIKNAFKIFFS